MVDLEQLETSSDPNSASTWLLVLSAAGIPHTVEADGTLFTLSVPKDYLLKAEYELATYYHENENWPPPKEKTDDFTPLFLPFSFLVIGILALFYNVTGPWSIQSKWFTLGAGSSNAIIYEGEWFRLVTALTLHADIVHLLGNCFIGGVLLHFLCKTLGNGLGLSSALLTAILGNFVNVMIHGDDHNFVGFSTMVFATVGVQTALRIYLLHNTTRSLLQVLAPFMASLGLLAMLGSSGERTDIGAHFFGLICGGGFGYIFSKPMLKVRHSIPIQLSCFSLSVFLIIFSWWCALSIAS